MAWLTVNVLSEPRRLPGVLIAIVATPVAAIFAATGSGSVWPGPKIASSVLRRF
jgi:hypothetical protein